MSLIARKFVANTQISAIKKTIVSKFDAKFAAKTLFINSQISAIKHNFYHEIALNFNAQKDKK